MIYTITNLTQVAECDLMLTWAGKEKAQLTLKKSVEESMIAKFADTAVQIEADLQGVNAELEFLNLMIPNLPEGPTKDEYLIKQEAKAHRKFVLETRSANYGSMALLQKQVEVARIEQEIEEVDAFIEAVNNQKIALAA